MKATGREQSQRGGPWWLAAAMALPAMVWPRLANLREQRLSLFAGKPPARP